MKRRFYLQAGAVRIDLNVPEHYFMLPSGLGTAHTLEFAGLGSGFFIGTKSEAAQPNVAGEIRFTGSTPYKYYRDFIDRVEPYRDELVLIYKPDAEEYRADVSLEYIQKGEVKARQLACPVSFYAKTPWYKQESLEYTVVQPEALSNPKRYSYPYPYRYGVDPSDACTLYTGGHIPAGLTITVPGPLNSPRLALQTPNGSLIGEMTLDGLQVAAGSTLRFSSKYAAENGIWVGSRSVIDYIDLASNNFFRLPPGKRCTLIVEDRSYNTLIARVSVFAYYKSV